MPEKRICILVVTYNAVSTVILTIQRIPPVIMEKIEEIIVCDDHSSDRTFDVAIDYKMTKKINKMKVFCNEKNLQYGGNQKKGYQYAINKGFDIVVLLHGDGQYAPEVMENLLGPIEKDEADLVLGSRMMRGSSPLQGGMPLYKFFGNKILTFFENSILNMNLSEFHSGYRVYSCKALRQLPIYRCSDSWHFDTDIIIQFKEKKFRIVEKPIPTYYGNEICYVNGISYAYRCLESVVKYRLYKLRLLNIEKFNIND